MATASVISVYMGNIPSDVVEWQRRCVEKFLPAGWEFRQDLYQTGRSHPSALAESVAKTANDIVVLLDIDCIPLCSDGLRLMAEAAATGTLVGAAQRSNHIENGDHLYASAFCAAFSKEAYRSVGSPAFDDTPRGDVLEEVTYRWQANAKPVSLFWPSSAEELLWPLANGRGFGLGTTYEQAVGGVLRDTFYHSFGVHGRIAYFPGNQFTKDRFISKCKQVMDDAVSAPKITREDPEAHPVSVVVLGRYRDVFSPFLESAAKFAPAFPFVLVRDGDDIPEPQGSNWTTVQGPEKFSMGGNANLGWRSVPETDDILYCGDDIRFLEERTVERLREIAYGDSRVGLLSPRIDGRGTPVQKNPGMPLRFCLPHEIWFPCVYIKRSLIQKIGFMDEQFTTFADDFDYCIRASLSDRRIAVTSLVTVRHEGTADGEPTTFSRSNPGAWGRQQNAMQRIRGKYSPPPRRQSSVIPGLVK